MIHSLCNTENWAKKRGTRSGKYSGVNIPLIETQSPLSVFGEIIGRGAPFFPVSIHCTAVIKFTIELERKYATTASRITAMSVHPAFTVVNPTPVADEVITIIIHGALGNIVLEI